MNSQITDIPEGFKMTELGLIPEEWKTTRLMQLMKLRIENVLPENVPDMRYVGLEHIDPSESKIRRWGNTQQVRSAKSHFYTNDILYGKLRPYLDKAALAEWEGVCSTDILVFAAYHDVADPDYLSYLLHTRSFLDHAVATTSGVNHPRTSWSSLSKFIAPLPPLPEQKAIARVLSTIQEAIEIQDKIIAAARELKKSLMRHLFTYGPVPMSEAENVPLKETEIGPVPEHWNVVRLGELGEIITGTTPSTKVSEYYGESHMFIAPGDIDQTKYITKTQKYLSDKGLLVSRPLPRDTVLVVCIGATIGKTAMTAVDNSVTNQQINAIITNQKIKPQYCYYAATYYSHLLPDFAGRAAIPIVNKSNFSKFLIVLPTISEQQEIINMLSAVDNKIEIEENRKTSLQALFKTMLHNLMTGKLRVNHLEATFS